MEFLWGIQRKAARNPWFGLFAFLAAFQAAAAAMAAMAAARIETHPS